MVNTSFMMGGALGLAVLASIAAARSEALLAAGLARALPSRAATRSPSPSALPSPRLAALVAAALLREPAPAPREVEYAR